MEGNDKFHEKVKENKNFVFSCEATDPRLRIGLVLSFIAHVYNV